MSAGKYTINVEQGSYWSVSIVYKDSAGVVVNLTGYSAKMQIRGYVDSASAWLTLTSGSGITLGGVLGAIILVITSTQSAALTDSGVYDLELIAPSGEVNRILQGTFKLNKEVTR